MNQVWLAFLTGLTTGGISCLAVQGGLLASTVSKKESVAMFLYAKFVGHAILGFFLGLAGSTLMLSPRIMGVVQITAGLFMLATAARMLDLHPMFRYAVIQPPRFTYRFLRRLSNPATLGFFTILMPCGVTQATMAVAVASGNPWFGAGIMGAFVLGTSPTFFVLGTAVLGLLTRKIFSYAAAAVVLAFALLSINGGLGLAGSFYTVQNLYRAATMSTSELASFKGRIAGVSTGGVQEVTIDARNNGYYSSASTLKAGIPVELTLATNNVQGCTRAFVIPDYGIRKVLPPTGSTTLAFVPTKTGRLPYSCGMGMFTGSFMVIP